MKILLQRMTELFCLTKMRILCCFIGEGECKINFGFCWDDPDKGKSNVHHHLARCKIVQQKSHMAKNGIGPGS